MPLWNIYKMNVIYPNSRTVFLAGTIDNGDSFNWQEDIINRCQDLDVIFYNPRRKHWPDNPIPSQIESQIRWEQEHLDNADVIIMCLLDDSKSPISLLELGLYAQSGKLIVFCNPEFYRYTNVKLTCQKYNIPLYKVNFDNMKSIIEIEIADL